jgi:hypothetical protein
VDFFVNETNLKTKEFGSVLQCIRRFWNLLFVSWMSGAELAPLPEMENELTETPEERRY